MATKAESEFVDQYCRKLTVEWANNQILGMEDPVLMGTPVVCHPLRVYLEFALTKGWVSKDYKKVSSVGFNTARAFLKR